MSSSNRYEDRRFHPAFVPVHPHFHAVCTAVNQVDEEERRFLRGSEEASGVCGVGRAVEVRKEGLDSQINRLAELIGRLENKID
ncbi:hypothetical protein EYF80_025550 [Liparis tanakae]|uniref:Uncharacterized protein n=1 Tax=Liparis tanakae TaxID=230148 RepID=A0A4Z2HH69_9TELE|nr:hypothetical protein EYF80_025550 [Liparis tanakae]